jgi:hypothetical protein
MTRIRLLQSRFSQSSVCVAIPLVLCLILALPTDSFARANIRIDSVPPEYTPTAGPGLPEPVSIASYYFEVNKETGRARVVVEYMYPDQPVFGLEGGVGPPPTLAQLPELIYDPPANAVVYTGEGRRTVCATVQQRKVLLQRKSIVKSTGACLVRSHTVDHAEDDGWRIRRFRVIDVFLEVR